MVTVELDIFSGRPNPRWTLSKAESKQLIERVRADPSLMLPLDAETGGLGYRGFVISEQEDEHWARAGLPSRIRLGGRFRPDSVESSSFLLHTAESTRLDLKDPGAVLGEAEKGILEAGEVQGLYSVCSPMVLTSDTSFTFWNDPAYRPYNNCYNYASNYRSNTFAQPGKASGQMYGGINCSEVGAAAQRDGWLTSCRTDANYNIALVIWPNYDFHWYRLAANGHWCHKPGQTAARNYDDSGNFITNPETCNRGPYTIFCGYYRGFDIIVK
jgi:hypothetical protein